MITYINPYCIALLSLFRHKVTIVKHPLKMNSLAMTREANLISTTTADDSYASVVSLA